MAISTQWAARILKKATTDDLGEFTLARLTEFSECTESTANLGSIGDEVTLNRFLASRKAAKLALPEQLLPAYDLAGDFVDVGRFLGGEPECMFNYDAHYDQARFVDVIIRLGRPVRTDNYKVFEYYANVLQAIDLLEAQGLRCRITATLDVFHKNKKLRITLSTPIKEYHDPVNMAVFAGVVLNNKFFSDVFCPVLNKHYGEYMAGYCYCSDMIDLEVPQTEQAITFPSMYFNNFDRQYSYPFGDYMRVIGLSHLLTTV